jgi:RNA polymerase sigma factor (TIGR02999 family)
MLAAASRSGPVQHDITTLLAQWNAGNAGAREEIVSKTYDELRRLARGYLRRERLNHTLQATALLNEVYLRFLPGGPRSAATREEFFRVMAAEMRRRLVDHARRRLAGKRGGAVRHESLDDVDSPAPAAPESLSADPEQMLDRLDRAVEELGKSHPRAAHVAQLRFIGGLTIEEIADDLKLSAGTVKREWTFAKAFLAASLEPSA